MDIPVFCPFADLRRWHRTHFYHVFEPQSGACTSITVNPGPEGPKKVYICGDKTAKISDMARSEDVNISRPCPETMFDLPAQRGNP